MVVSNYTDEDDLLGNLVTRYNGSTERAHIPRAELLRNLLVFHPW